MKKLTIDIIKRSFESENFKLLTNKYINNKQKLEFICPNGHHHSIRWNDWQSKHRCGLCQQPSYKYEDIKNEFEKENYILLTTYYINKSQKLEFICPNGHQHSITWDNWNNLKQRCGKCYKTDTVTYDIVKKSFEDEGYQLLSTEYKNSNTLLHFICPNKHQHFITWSSWQQKHRCGKCYYIEYQKRTDIIRNKLNKENYTLISTDGKNLKFTCPNGHHHSTTWTAWKNGTRCGKCYKTDTVTYDIVKKSFEDEGYQLLSTKYKGSHEKLSYICPKGHQHSIVWYSWYNGRRCGLCSYNKSQAELEIKELIESWGFKTESHKQLIAPLELDIIISDKKIAIEYCGLYWHSELQGKDRNYHLNKLQLCNKKGYRLITIFEDEWLHCKDIVINRLKNILNTQNTKRIHARSCNIKELNYETTSNFLKIYHLQNKGQPKIKLGAFHNEELVAVMTFSRPSIAKGSRNQDFWEINRFCTHKDYHIPGIASKLLTYFERNYEWNKIISYADRRWSIGDVYYNMGFNLVSETKPNYWYLDKNNTRCHRYALRKKPDEPKNKTEWELRQEQGYDRIWDCGSLKFEKVNHDNHKLQNRNCPTAKSDL